ncbi:hypothetical protein MTP04_19300 [Lysinibacillus sp. PLM2]|nr:hypothetical protein MTP04_19300 [Lysinibacillus sp. PLM2]
MWSLTGKIEKIRDKEGYKKLQGKYSILMGIFFLTFALSLYLVKGLNINPEHLYLWLLLLAFTILLNAFQARKFY